MNRVRLGGCGPRNHLHETAFLWHLADTDTPSPASACGDGADVFGTHLLRQLLTQSRHSRMGGMTSLSVPRDRLNAVPRHGCSRIVAAAAQNRNGFISRSGF